MQTTEGFMEQLRHAGKMDSSGHFTICLQHNFTGLKVFEDSSECLLKLIQSAVRARANSLEVRIGVRSVEVAFDPEGDYSTSELLSQMSDPSKPWAPLLLALRGALGVGFQEVRFTSWSAGEGRALRLSEGEIKESEPFSWPWNDESGVRVKLIRSSGLFSLKSLSARFSESRVLSRRCRFCPIPLRSSGFLLNNPELFSDIKRRGSSVIEAIVRPEGEEEIGICGPTPEYRWTHSLTFEDKRRVGVSQFFSPENSGQPYLFVTIGANREEIPSDIVRVRPADPTMKRATLQKAKAVLGYCQFGNEQTLIFPIVDGVRCQCLRVSNLQTAAVVYIAAEGLNTDFSGFQIIQDDKVDRLVEEVESYLDIIFTALEKTEFASLGPVTDFFDNNYDDYEVPDDA